MKNQSLATQIRGLLLDPGHVLATFILNFVPSILIPTAFGYYKWVSQSEAILLGFLIWTLLTCAEALYKINTIAAEEARQREIWTIESNFEARLLAIRDAQHKILEGRRRD